MEIDTPAPTTAEPETKEPATDTGRDALEAPGQTLRVEFKILTCSGIGIGYAGDMTKNGDTEVKFNLNGVVHRDHLELKEGTSVPSFKAERSPRRSPPMQRRCKPVLMLQENA